MGRRRQLLWFGALAPVVVVLLTVAAWALDTGSAGGQVLRNVDLAGKDIGGLASDQLLEHLDAMNASMDDRPIRIVTPEVSYGTTAGEIGLSVDTVATAAAALDEGRASVLPARPFAWLASFLRPHDVDVHYRVDTEVARAALRQLEGEALMSPEEPTIESIEGEPFRAVPGHPGSGIDPETLSVALAVAARNTPYDEPVTVRIQQSPLEPRLPDSVAEAAAASANELTSNTLSVTAEDRTIQLVPRELRSLATVNRTAEGISISLEPDTVLSVLTDEFADLERPAEDASFDIVGGAVQLTPAVVGRTCCSLASAEQVGRAFAAGQTEVTVELTDVEPDLTTEEAQALGIVEEVGSPDAFGPTTHHKCCQNRVTNIHRIADIVRGAVIRPGETFSINDYVGQRTREKGFVSDGVIYNGVVTEDVGGGVSQFATTLFNAALFAGLDFGEYQSHSLYISRYPKGHEATISFPHPDLQIENDTPYGVLLWPTYTDTSLTVHLYSTRYADVTIGDPTPSPQGNCTTWTTPRTRTYPDGSTDRDTVHATYRPEEGASC